MRSRGRQEEDEQNEEVPLGHLAFLYTETSIQQYLLDRNDEDDERWFTPSGSSLDIFWACEHHEHRSWHTRLPVHGRSSVSVG